MSSPTCWDDINHTQSVIKHPPGRAHYARTRRQLGFPPAREYLVMESMQETFAGKKVLVTGHTGFKGSWLTIWLKSLRAEVTGISLDPIQGGSLFEDASVSEICNDFRFDIRDHETLAKVIRELQPDFVFHLAAQAIVSESYIAPRQTWETNVIGTLNLLEGLRAVDKLCSVVLITSDKAYQNNEWVWGYRETDALGGKDPYSASKAAAELLIKSYISSYFDGSTVRISSARAGNVIGGGDWSKDRIVPDAIRAWKKAEPAVLRSPQSTRPWQHVLEPLGGYLQLAQALSRNSFFHGESFNFGPGSGTTRTVADLVTELSRGLPDASWLVSQSQPRFSEAGLLALNCDKALHLLNWRALLNFEETAEFTANWYRSWAEDSSQSLQICLEQISDYTQKGIERSLHG